MVIIFLPCLLFPYSLSWKNRDRKISGIRNDKMVTEFIFLVITPSTVARDFVSKEIQAV